MDVLMKDKKKSGSTMNFVILTGIGSAEVRPIPVDTLRGLVNDLRMRI
jgi:3-dehydroquinate synthetase